MKKLLFIAVCCLMLCGCGKKFEVSNFKWKKIAGLYHITGSIKNNSSEKCSHPRINLIYKNGGLEEESNCIPSLILESGEAKNVECLYTGKLSNIEDYEIIVKKVECQDYLYN